MDENLAGMYNDMDDDTEHVAVKKGALFRRNGKLTEVTIDGNRVVVVDPSVIVDVENMIKTMQSKISILEQEIRQLHSRINRTDRVIAETVSELDNKISYQ